jgi:hypothetical protein
VCPTALSLWQMEPVSEQVIDRVGRGPVSEDHQREYAEGERDGEEEPVFLQEGDGEEGDQ